MECITETVRHAASRKGVMQIGSCGASRIVVTECVTENISDHRMYHFRNAMEKSSWMVSWKETHVQRHGKASWKAIAVERHGKAVTECVTESMTQAASRKKRHGKRRGGCDVMIVNSLV